MNIIICGAGMVGFSISKQLQAQGHSVTVIDQSSEDIKKINDTQDVKGIVGRATLPSVLESAGAKDTDMIIAVTRNDEINMIVCQIASSLFNISKKIARIRSQEYLNPKFKSLFNQLEAMHQKHSFVEDLSLLMMIYRALMKVEKIHFLGEPLEGIQFMGLLETRLLDFDNLVITNLNEGILPAGKKNNSYLPFDLRKKFNLPTFLENDGIYTYHFYRLLQRAKRVYLLYNTQSDGLNSKEMSRFLYQLKYQKQTHHQIEEKQLIMDYQTPDIPERKIEKTENIRLKLKAIAEKGFSPSSLSLYLRNPVDFYYQRVLGIKEKTTMEFTINNMNKGNLVHEVIEQLYLPYKNQILSVLDFKEMKKRLLPLMEEHYKSIYHGSHKKTGRNHIIFQVLKKSILDFLEVEQKQVKEGNQIKILYLEHPFERSVSIPGIDFPIKLIGAIDRIDLYNETLRIIDYKTGKIELKHLNLPYWEVFDEQTEYAYLFQILLLSLIHI